MDEEDIRGEIAQLRSDVNAILKDGGYLPNRGGSEVTLRSVSMEQEGLRLRLSRIEAALRGAGLLKD